MKVAQGNMSKLLEYDQVKSYTSQLFEHYMDYKLLLRQLQIIIKDSAQFETKYGLVNALDTSLQTLLSIKAVFRAEQAKIVRAVDYLSKHPASIQGKTPASNLKLSRNVQTILDQLLPSQSSSVLSKVTTAALGPADATPETPERVEPNFDFASLIPPEVWSDVMPVPKKDGKYSSQTTAISLGDFKLPLTPEAALTHAGQASMPQTSILPQLDESKRYQELLEQVREAREAKENAAKDKEAADARLREANGKITTKESEVKSLQQQIESKTNDIKALESKVTEAKGARAEEVRTQQEKATDAERKLREAMVAAKADDGTSWKDKYTTTATDLASRTSDLKKTKEDLSNAEQALKAPDGQTWKQKHEIAERDKLASFAEAQNLKNRQLPNEENGTKDGIWILLAHFGGRDYASNENVCRNIRECFRNKTKVGTTSPYGGSKSWVSIFGEDPLPGTWKSIALAYRRDKTGPINFINILEGMEFQF